MSDPLPRLSEALADRYRLERELGQGGMATVYLAQDIKHDRRVAVKVLRPELAAVIGAERFLSEIKTTANLQHPHILPLFDSGEADGFLFYVMPYVEGETVRDRMNREKQLPVADAVRITTEVASALDYAHRHNVIHRDIKPENILLHDGSALVADFGIALAASKAGGTRMTETGMSLGTPHYMSPEQAMGEREITARSDVYALGCVLYEMLTGDPPFTGSTAQAIVARVVTETPRPMLPQRGTIPAHVEAAVLTSLQKLPADRFKTAAEFAEALADRQYTSSATIAMSAASAPRSRVATHRSVGACRRGPGGRTRRSVPGRWHRRPTSVRSGSRSPSRPSCRRSPFGSRPTAERWPTSAARETASPSTRDGSTTCGRAGSRGPTTDSPSAFPPTASRSPISAPTTRRARSRSVAGAPSPSRSREGPGSPPSSSTGPTGSSCPPRAPSPPSPRTGR